MDSEWSATSISLRACFNFPHSTNSFTSFRCILCSPITVDTRSIAAKHSIYITNVNPYNRSCYNISNITITLAALVNNTELRNTLQIPVHDPAACTILRQLIFECWPTQVLEFKPIWVVNPNIHYSDILKWQWTNVWIESDLAIWDHTVLPATRKRWHSCRYSQTIKAGTRFSNPGKMQGWVDPVGLVKYRSGIPARRWWPTPVLTGLSIE